jgi:hypothetical protein
MKFFSQSFFRDVSTTSAPLDITEASQQLLTSVYKDMAQVCFGTELDYRTDICRVKKGLTLRTFVTSSYKLKDMYCKTMLGILAKSLIISFQYNTESVYFFYSNTVYH